MTTTIPRTLKKKLQASLANLTPRQSGRLFLILFHEALDKGYYPLDHPPLKELEAAWDKRFAQAEAVSSRDHEAYRRELSLFNGWLYLRAIVGTVNMTASSDVWRLLYKVQTAFVRIDRLLLVDSFSEAARKVADFMTSEYLPKPASREEYARLTTWAEEEAFEPLFDVAVLLTEDWLEGQDFETLSPPLDFIREYNAAQGETDVAALFFENKHNRRAWAEAEGDRLLGEVFAGNRDDLEAWVAHGDYVKDAYRRAQDAKEAELEARLVAMLEAGDLEGGLAVSLEDCYDPVVITAGKIPAWAALRSVWLSWLYDQGYRTREEATIHPKALEGVRVVYNVDGEVDALALATLAGDFLKDCKKRPWGRNLPAPKSVDLDALGFFLTIVDTPLTAVEAPDLGRVDWEAFKTASDLDNVKTFFVATVRSLKAKAVDLGAGFSGHTWILDQYYPTDRPEDRRRDMGRALRLLESMRVSHRAFVYPQEDRSRLADFLGREFWTPLEEAVGFLGEVFGEAATFKRTYAILGDEYFGGLSVLNGETRAKLEVVDQVLTAAEEYLAGWLERLEGDLWRVDTTSLKLVKAAVDEERARAEADALLALAKTHFKKVELDLGPEDPPPPAKGKRT